MKESKPKMKHSNSWPDHVLTVKVRVNPMSKAYTIVDQDQLRMLTSDSDIYKLKKIVSCTESNSPKINQLTIIDQTYEQPQENKIRSIALTVGGESPVKCNQNQTIDKLRNFGERITLTLIEEKTMDNRNKNLITENNIKSIRLDSVESNSGSLKENVRPPIITVVDYDKASILPTWRSRHACAKCKSEGFLKLQVDPFRPSMDTTHRHTSTSPERDNFLNRPLRSRSNSFDVHRNVDKCLGKRAQSFSDNPKFINDVDDTVPRTLVSHRKEMTLRRHYYPEGGWGFVIVTCSALVHFLGVGLQFAAPGTFYISAQIKFHHPPLHSSGN